jgi:hypothetical protein
MAVETSKMFYIDPELDSEERYDMAKFMEWVNDNHDPITSNLFEDIRKIQSGGSYTIQGENGRPDLVSYEIYGDTQYWWILLVYNSLTTFNTFTNGEAINFPSLSALEDYYFSLKIKQDKQDKEV